MSKKLSDSDERLFDKHAAAEAGPLVDAHERSMTMLQGTAALTKTAVGAGLLGLSVTFALVGWVIGTILLLFGGATTLISLYFYGRLSFHLDTGDFVTIARRAQGRFGEIIVVISILCYLIAPMIGYIKLSGYFLASLITLWSETTSSFVKPWIFSLIITGAFIFPLTFLNDMSKLSYTSIAGMCIILYVTALTMIDYIVDKASHVTGSPSFMDGKTPVAFGEVRAFASAPASHMIVRCFYAFCVMLMAYISHTSIPSICHSLINPTAKRRLSLMTISNIVVFALYFIAALFGYLHFGDRILYEDADMIVMQKVYSVSYQIAMFGVALVLAVSYPLILLPFRESIDWLVCQLLKRETDKVPIIKSPKKILINVATLAITCGIACVIDSVVVLFSIAGSFGALIGFILPSVYMLKLSNKISVKKTERTLCYIMIVIGVIVGLGGLITCVLKFTNPEIFGGMEGAF